MTNRWLRLGLIAGVAGSAAYFLIPPLLIPFFPGYDWTRQVVSDLGAHGAPTAAVFNPAMILIGLAMAAGGVAQAAKLGSKTHRALAWLTGLSMVSLGGATVVAGAFPLPDPRHAAGAVLLPAALAYPVLATAAFWREPRWRAGLFTALVSVAAAVAVMLGWIELDQARWRGLIQRASALTVYGPTGVVCWALWRERKAG